MVYLMLQVNCITGQNGISSLWIRLLKVCCSSLSGPNLGPRREGQLHLHDEGWDSRH